MEVVEQITLREIEESGQPTIYYGANTMWWTHDPSHLYLTPPPTEERIGQLAETLRMNSGRTNAPLDDYLPMARQAMQYRMPCDPRGGMLMEGELHGFISAARKSREFYGRHGLRAFLASHHLNSVYSLEDRRPWCEATWEAYNDAIDRLDERKRLEG